MSNLPPARGPRFELKLRGLTFQLVSLTILPLVLGLLAITFGSLAIHQNAMRDLVGERDVRAVLAAARAIESEINHRQAAVQGIAARLTETSPEMVSQILSDSAFLGSDFDGGLAVFSHSGTLAAHTGGDELWNWLASAGEPAVNAVLSGQGPAGISPVFTVPDSQQMMVLISARAAGGWLVVGAFSPAHMAERTLAETFSPQTSGGLLIVDRAGNLLYNNSPLQTSEAPSRHPGVAEALSGQNGMLFRKVGEDEHVVAYAPVSAVGWAIVLEESWRMVANPTLQTTQLAPLALVPVLLIALLVLWFGARQVVKPLQDLEAKANRLAWGDFQAIEEQVTGIAEIRDLQAELVEMARKVQAAQRGLHGYIGAITKGQEEERRRLARDLHDDTIQSLIALKQRVQLTRMSLKSEVAARSLAELESLAEQTIEDLRRLTRALRPIYLEDLGLVTALEMLARETTQNSGQPVEFKRAGIERRLAPEIELALYRIAQEALTNVVRHAQAKHSTLEVQFADDGVTMLVQDNGRGFEVPRSPTEFVPAGHFGLLGLYERAELIGARLRIDSAPGRGTQVQVSLQSSPGENAVYI